MKLATHAAVFFSVLALCALATPVAAAAADDARLRVQVSSLPLAFEPNLGQAPGDIRYVSHGPGMRLELAPDGARLTPTTGEHQSRTVRLRLVGTTVAPTLMAQDGLPGKAHYVTGNDPTAWLRDVPTYRRVVYRGVYPGTDLVFHGTHGAAEFDFVVAAGADPRRIRFEIAGADTIRFDGDDVIIAAGGEVLRLHAPVVYQESPTGRVRVDGRFRLRGRHVAFDIGAYDRARPLVIDPVVTYATYLNAGAAGVGVDGAGNIYVTTLTALLKLSADGSTLLWSASFADMRVRQLVVDSAGNAYMQGTCPYNRSGVVFTCPTLNGLTAGRPQSQGDIGAYVLKVGPSGSLLFSTSMGGTGSVTPGGIGIDAAGNIYATAWDVYSGYPLTRQPYAILGGSGTFIAVVEAIAADLSRFLYVVEFQTGSLEPTGLAVDRAGAAYVTGFASSTDFPTTPGSFQPTTNGVRGAGAVAKLAPDGSLAYATYFGNESTRPRGIAVDADGNAYIAGAAGAGLPTLNAMQPALAGGTDAFVARLDPSGSTLMFSTYLGGGGDDAATALSLDASANIYVAGTTRSTDFPQRNPLSAQFGSAASNFVAELNSDASALVYSTYFADAQTNITAASATATGTLYLAGTTSSTSFPTVRPYQATPGGGFVAKLEPSDVRVFITSPAEGATVSGSVWSDVWAENYVGTSNTFTLSIGNTVLATGTATNHATLAWDSRQVADGPQTLTATVRDSAGHTGTAMRAVTIRNGTTPTLTAAFTSPAANATVAGTVSVGMSETGASGTPITFTLTVDGGQVFTASGNAATATFAWTTTTVADGPHTLGLSVRDGAGRTATATRGVTVSNNGGGAGSPLTASFTSPAEGATVTGTVGIGMSETGASGTPITFTLAIDGTQAYTTSGTATSASFNWNTTGATSGPHTLALTVRDGAGRTATATRNVTVGGGGTLKVFITSPAAGATVNGTVWSDVWVEGAAAGTRTFTLAIGGVTLVSTTDSSNHVTLPWDSTRVANGTQTLVATVRDAAGNSGSTTRAFNVQNAGGGTAPPPLAASFTAPAEGATVAGTVTVGMSASGASGTPIAFSLTVDGTQVFATSGAATSASFSWNTASVGDGAHTLRLTVQDGAGRSATATRGVTVQNATPPPPPPGGPIGVFITQPRNGDTVRGVVWFTIWIEGAAAGSKTYTLSEGGRTLATTTTTSSGPVSIPWSTTAADNGARTPTIGVRDSAGATGSGSINVTVAN
ncbi:MAG TPA: Ig-like domain-containing protein [Methylomirabilota bacterium]